MSVCEVARLTLFLPQVQERDTEGDCLGLTLTITLTFLPYVQYWDIVSEGYNANPFCCKYKKGVLKAKGIT